MTIIKKSLLTLVLIIGLTGCNEETKEEIKESPIRIDLKKAYNSAWKYFYPKVLITSTVDTVKVNNVIVNKGNCKPTLIEETRQTLNYGAQMEVRYKQNCNVMLIEVITDQGNWMVKF